MLEKVDLVALYRRDRKNERVDFNDPLAVEDPLSSGRLLEHGLIANGTGALTEKGKEQAAALDAAVEKLSKGVPIEKRKLGSYRAIFEDPPRSQWKEGKIGNKTLVTNKDMFFFGSPENGMKPTLAVSSYDARGPRREALAGKFVPATPLAFQVVEFGTVEVVWIVSEDGNKLVPIQAKYFDFVQYRFPKGIFFVAGRAAPVQVRVQKQGLKGDVIAAIQPVSKLNEGEEVGKLRDEAVQRWGLPTDKGKGSSIRGE